MNYKHSVNTQEMQTVEHNQQDHQHTYHVATGPVTIRYCAACDASWVLDGS